MKTQMENTDDEIKAFKVKLITGSDYKEIFTHINPMQVEKKYGGKSDNLLEGSFFPPNVVNEEFFLKSDKSNLIDKQEYYDRYKEGKLDGYTINNTIIEEFEVKKKKKEMSTQDFTPNNITPMGITPNIVTPMEPADHNSMEVKDLDILIMGEDEQFGSNNGLLVAEDGVEEKMPSHTN